MPDFDKRAAPRRRVLKDGVIQAAGTGTTCTVRNISETGALLLTDLEPCPAQITLVIISENLVRKCDVVWRDGKKLGVAFV
jgi:hypothetical protein